MSRKPLKQIEIIKWKDEFKVVSKSNAMAELPNRLTSIEQKAVLFVIAQVEPWDSEITMIRFSASKLIDFLGINSHNISKIREILKWLRAKTITINTGSVLDVGWFASCEYFPGWEIEIELSQKLSPYLIGLKSQFFSYKLYNVLRLSGSYSIRFYEIMKKFERIGTFEYSLVELRNILWINPHEYKLYGHFKAKILEPSKKEISEKTDMTMEYEEIKTGRSITSIKFRITSNGREKKSIESADDKLVAEICKMVWASGATVKSLLSKYPRQKIMRAAKDTSNKSGTVNNLPGYFRTLVENPKFMEKELERMARRSASVEKIEDEAPKKQSREKLVDEWVRTNPDNYEDIVEEMKKDFPVRYPNLDIVKHERILISNVRTEIRKRFFPE